MKPRARLLVLALAATAGCAPSATFRAPTPMLPGQSNEIGFGFTGGIEVAPRAKDALIGNADFWYYRQIKWFDIGVRAFAGTAPQFNTTSNLINAAAGAGVVMRARIVNLDRFKLGVDLNGGFMYGQLAVPLALQASERVWVYSAPGVALFGGPDHGAGMDIGIPIGFSLRATHYMYVLMETSAHILGPSVFFFDGSVGTAFRF